MEELQTTYFEDLDPFAQEIIVELVASIIENEGKNDDGKEVTEP